MQLGFSPIQGDAHYREAIEEVRYADANGLDSVFLQEHHEDPDQFWSDPLSVLAGFATVTDAIDLGTAILLLPLYDPRRLAERGAIVDGLSDGRFVLGAAVGYRPREFELMDVPRGARGAVFEEYLTLVSRAWSEDAVSFEGDHISVEGFSCTPRPASRPRPRIWIGGYHRVVLDRAARFADAGLADCWFPGTQPDRDGLAARRRGFERNLVDRGVDPATVDQPVFRDGVIAETSEEAARLAREYIVPGYESQYKGMGHEPSERGDLGHDVIHRETYEPEELIEDRFLVGDPDDWLCELEGYEDALGVDHTIVRIYFEGMSHDLVMDQLELLCEEVAPRLRTDG